MSDRFMKSVLVIMMLAFTVSAVSGCKVRAQRYDYHPTDETPKGPGIFTGKKGEIGIGR